jgi:hypothetical protein
MALTAAMSIQYPQVGLRNPEMVKMTATLTLVTPAWRKDPPGLCGHSNNLAKCLSFSPHALRNQHLKPDDRNCI